MRAALYLNSESPRRQALLGQLGVAFVTISAAIDETWNGVETPACHVERLALEKAHETAELLRAAGIEILAPAPRALDRD